MASAPLLFPREIFESNDMQCVDSGNGVVFAEHDDNILPNHYKLRVWDDVAFTAG